MHPIRTLFPVLALFGTKTYGLLTPAQHTTDDLYAIITQLNDSLKRMETTVAHQNATIQTLVSQQRSSALQSVGFYAQLSHTIDQLGDDQTIEFDKVVTNIGNAYDPRHGHFIAPVNGMYLISASVMSLPGTNLFCSMMKNAGEVTRFYGGTADYQSDSQTIVMELQSGDMVWIKHYAAHPNERLNGYNSYFSGFLIKAH